MERSPVDLADVLAFARVAETGSFARAAERLGVSKSIVSRRVARVEAQLGASLLARTARGAQPTDIGADYYARIAIVMAELEAAHEAVAAATQEVAGPIRLTAPLTFGVHHLAPALADFMAAHPRVELDLSFEDRTVDLVGGGYDLAVRIGSLPDSALIARKLAPVRAAVVASPAYLAARGRPRHPRDLAGHDGLFYSNLGPSEEWRLRVGNRLERVRPVPRLRANNGEMLREAACAGLGIAVLPTFIVSDCLQSGKLEIVLPDCPPDESTLHAVMPPGRAATARIRAIVDFLVARFGPEPSWDPCWKHTASRPSRSTVRSKLGPSRADEQGSWDEGTGMPKSARSYWQKSQKS